MDTYNKVSKLLSKRLTLEYSSSFGISSRLFSSDIRDDIYAIYGLVRIADEIVDTYNGTDAIKLLDELEQETYGAIKRQYSTNPIVQSFAQTATQYGIDQSIIQPFFLSMRFDDKEFSSLTLQEYEEYIYGSAEVIGLMCLRVFCKGDKSEYKRLAPGAQALGSAYQKVNFLRDIAADYNERGRVYFPGLTYKTLDDKAKVEIIADIEADFTVAKQAIKELPKNARTAVATSYIYYSKLLTYLKNSDIETIKNQRIRISTPKKIMLLAGAIIKVRLGAL